MTPSDVKATLSFSDGSPTMDLPIYKGTIGPDVIDIRKLYAQTGKFTYDPGFLSTASCNSTSPTSTATRASCCIAATRSSNWRSIAIFSRPAIYCSTANCRTPAKRRNSSTW